VIVIRMEGIVSPATIYIGRTGINCDIVPADNGIAVVDHIMTSVNVDVDITGIYIHITAAFIDVCPVIGFIIPVAGICISVPVAVCHFAVGLLPLVITAV
jgi:hypothetical protein